MPLHSQNRHERRAPAKGALAKDAFAYTLQDAERLTGLSNATLRRRAKEGLLQLVKVGGRTLAVGDSLRALVGLGGAE